MFQTLTSKYPKSFAIKLTYARILFEKKDYTQATSLANQLTKTDAGNPDVQTLNAMLLLNTGKIDDAFTLLKKAVKDNPNSASDSASAGTGRGGQGGHGDRRSQL